MKCAYLSQEAFDNVNSMVVSMGADPVQQGELRAGHRTYVSEEFPFRWKDPETGEMNMVHGVIQDEVDVTLYGAFSFEMPSDDLFDRLVWIT